MAADDLIIGLGLGVVRVNTTPPTANGNVEVQQDTVLCTSISTSSSPILETLWQILQAGSVIASSTLPVKQFTGLAVGNYSARITVTNKTGTPGSNSDSIDIDFTIVDAESPAQLTGLTVDAVNNSDLTLSYDTYVDTDGDLFGATFVLGDDDQATIANTLPSRQFFVPAATILLNDPILISVTTLPPEDYFVNVITHDTHGNPVDPENINNYVSEPFTVPAGQAPAPGAFTLIDAVALSSTAVRVRANRSTDADSYSVQRKPDSLGAASFGVIGEVLDDGQPIQSFVDSGCVPETEYEYRWIAVNETDATTSSNTKIVTTPAQSTWPNNEPAHSVANGTIILNFQGADKYYGYPPPANPGAAGYSPPGSGWTFGTSWQAPVTENDAVVYNVCGPDAAAPFGNRLKKHMPVGSAQGYNGQVTYNKANNPVWATMYERLVFKFSDIVEYNPGGEKIPGYFGVMGSPNNIFYMLIRDGSGGAGTQGILKWLHCQIGNKAGAINGADADKFYAPTTTIIVTHGVYHTLEYYYVAQSDFPNADSTLLIWWDGILLGMFQGARIFPNGLVGMQWFGPGSADKCHGIGGLIGPLFDGGSGVKVTTGLDYYVAEQFVRNCTVRP
jgi:hypothetical protein